MRNYRGVIDGDELLSTLAAKVWEKRNDFNPERGGFSTWIEQLCRSVRSSLYEKHKTNVKYGLHSLDAHLRMDENEVCFYDFIEDKKANSAEKQLILGELAADIKACLKEMSDNQRAAIEAIYIEGLKPSEAGKLLGRKMGDLYNDHNRALNTLRKKLEAMDVTREEILQLIND